jgi:hypothetical protein
MFQVLSSLQVFLAKRFSAFLISSIHATCPFHLIHHLILQIIFGEYSNYEAFFCRSRDKFEAHTKQQIKL